MALDFRRSQRYWKQLGSVLLDDGSPHLRDVPVVDWMDSKVVFKNAKPSLQMRISTRIWILDLALMESSVQRIVARRGFFVMVSEVLSGLVRGRTLVQQIDV